MALSVSKTLRREVELKPEKPEVMKPWRLPGEEPFQLAIEAEPWKWSNYLMFADWLEEQGDWRAPGYRWLGENRKRPFRSTDNGLVCWNVVAAPVGDLGEFEVPMEFYDRLAQVCESFATGGFPARRDFFFYFLSFQHARDALCLQLKEQR
jgi:uncharacterized protein (TIGR02996 family)